MYTTMNNAPAHGQGVIHMYTTMKSCTLAMADCHHCGPTQTAALECIRTRPTTRHRFGLLERNMKHAMCWGRDAGTIITCTSMFHAWH